MKVMNEQEGIGVVPCVILPSRPASTVSFIQGGTWASGGIHKGNSIVFALAYR